MLRLCDRANNLAIDEFPPLLDYCESQLGFALTRYLDPLRLFICAGLAELVDALDSDSSVRKDFRVQVPGSALRQFAL